jgi:hypothetical protein
MGDPMDIWPVEPPLAASADEQIIAALERLRATFRWKAGGLDDAGLRATLGRSALTLGGLLKHLAAVESLNLTWGAFHEDPGEPWRSHDWADPAWPFTSAAEDSPQYLYALYDDAVAKSRRRLAAAVADGGLDQLTYAGSETERASLRRVITDLIEEYGRHTGHADLLRENVDGRVGEDPPEGWQPEPARP